MATDTGSATSVEDGGFVSSDEPVNTEPPTLDMDWTASVCLQHFSFMLQHFLPQHSIKRDPNLEKKVGEDLAKMIRSNDKSWHLVGGHFEGLSLPPSEKEIQADIPTFQMLAVFDELNVGYKEDSRPYYAYVDTSKSHEGFCQLRADKEGRFTTDLKGSHFVSRKKMETFKLEPNETIEPGDTETFSSSLIATSSVLSHQLVALPCPKWPEAASEWKSRKRGAGWPSSDIVDKIVKQGCFIIPGSHPKTTNQDLEWEFCFATAECCLAKSLNDVQRQCFMLLKMIYYQALDLPPFIKLHHLKSLFFWSCEKIPQEEWNEENLPSILLSLVDELLHAIINGELSNFFIRKNNMIDHIPEDFEFDLMEKVSKARQNPLEILFTFTKLHRIPRYPKLMQWKELFQPLLDDMEEQHDQIVKSLEQGFMPTATKIAVCYIREHRFEEAIESYRKLKVVYSSLTEEQLLSHLSSVALAVEDDIDTCIGFHEQLRAAFPGNKGLYSLLGNMGCMYHSKAQMVRDEKERKEILEKANEAFQAALSEPNASAATFTDYANFLCGTDQHADAIPQLLQVIEIEKRKPTAGNQYGIAEKETMDEYMQKEIEGSPNGNISLPSLIYSSYLLVDAYTKTDQKDLATEFVKTFKQYVQLTRKAINFSALGYALMKLEDFTQAEESFAEALRLNPNYDLARQNKELCEAMKLSMACLNNET